MGFGNTGGQAYNPNKDVELTSPPTDGISSLSWSPTANFIVATSWDKNVRCWEVQANGQSQPKAMVSHSQPVLCCDWSADGTTVFAGDCDRAVQSWNLQTNQQTKIAEHQAPVRHLKFISEMNLLVTASWDKTLKYWDLRSPNAVFTHQLPERCYALDCQHPLLVVGTADRHIQIFNLANPQVVFKNLQSPLKFQTRCISCFPDKQVGQVEYLVVALYVSLQCFPITMFSYNTHTYIYIYIYILLFRYNHASPTFFPIRPAIQTHSPLSHTIGILGGVH